jgi:hypothetical protein
VNIKTIAEKGDMVPLLGLGFICPRRMQTVIALCFGLGLTRW